MGIEEYPVVKSLEFFASKLSEEYRSKLYETAEQFLRVGAMQGALAWSSDSFAMNEHQEYIEYLSMKAKKYSV